MNDSEEQQLENLMGGVPEEDLSEARRLRCIPIVEKIMKELLDKDLLYSDVPYVQTRVMEIIQMMHRGVIIEHFNQIFELLHTSLNNNLDRAEAKLWGKEREDIKLKDIDEALKKK